MRKYQDDDIGLLAMGEPDYLTCNNHSHVIGHMLDDLKSGVDSGGFSVGFHESNVPLLAVDYHEPV